MMRRLITALAMLRNDGAWITVYCQACGQHMPIGHGCQGGNGR